MAYAAHGRDVATSMRYAAERRTGAEMSPRRLALLLLAVLLALGVMLTPATLLAQETTYSASLAGSEEVPPVSTDASGTFTATVDLATGAVAYVLGVRDISGATAAHIHLAAPDENGPIVINLFAAEGAGASSIDVSGTASVADLVGPVAGDPLGFVTALLAGNLYVNVHTVANPPGEIRGQLQPGAPAPPASPRARERAQRAQNGRDDAAMAASRGGCGW